MAPAVVHVVHEFITSLNWLLPLSAMITAMIRNFSGPKFHSPSGDPKTFTAAETTSMSTFRTPSLSPAKDTKREPITSGGDKMLKLNSPPNTVVRPTSTSTQHHSPRESHSLSIMSLPVEIRLLILQQCAPIPSERQGPDSLDTFLKLLHVSKTIQQEAYTACLPHIPLALWSKKGVHSYRALLHKKPELGCLVQHLWIGTGKLDDEEVGWGLDIIRVVTQLRSLACGEHLLAHAMNRGLLAKTCERVTLMGMEKEIEYKAWGIKQVRLCTGVYSTKERFPDVTTLCFNARRINVKDERVKVEYEAVDRWVKNVGAFILVERDAKRVSSRGMEVKFKVGKRTGRPKMFSVTLPARWTEWDIWSSDVVGTGVWDICGLA